MIVFRLSKNIYANDLTGKGAEIYGGRWNSIGTPMIYTAESRALCAVEIAVNTPLSNIPTDYSIISFQIPEENITSVKEKILPINWNILPYSHSTIEIGDLFISEKKSLVLKVPSAIIAGDYNYLINPLYHNLGKLKILKIEDFSFDNRLFKNK